MANTLLTPTQVTRKALMILHQKLNFVGSINRGYDDSFAKDGARIGDTLKIRLPNQYTVRTGPTLSAQDTAETTINLQVATQKGVDVNFSSNELTLGLDDFSDRILAPAMSSLAANIEADAMNMFKDVYQAQTFATPFTSSITFRDVLQSRKILNNSLAPLNNRTVSLNPNDNVNLVDALKGLFQDQTALSKQYREGYMGHSAGFDFTENTLWPALTTGTENGSAASIQVNGAGQTGSAITVTNGSSKTLAVGDVITFSGCFQVHPESKATLSNLQQFTVTSAVGTSGTSISISPAIVITGAAQNVSAAPTTGTTITKVGTASQLVSQSMAYQKNAFAFATADLVMPRGVDFAAREVLDGISMRIVRQYDITNDKFPCRIDVLYGYKTVRPQLACRLNFA